MQLRAVQHVLVVERPRTPADVKRIRQKRGKDVGVAPEGHRTRLGPSPRSPTDRPGRAGPPHSRPVTRPGRAQPPPPVDSRECSTTKTPISALKGKTVAIIGYGSQGHAQAQNLRDSGVNVVVGQRPGGKNYDLAESATASSRSRRRRRQAADVINILVPDELQGDLYENEIKANLKPGSLLMLATASTSTSASSSRPPASTSRSSPPRAPATSSAASSSPAAASPASSPSTRTPPATLKIGLAYAKGIGGTRGGVIQTTFTEETETDLFGEQAVLCGGASALVKAGFETLVEAGYQPEMAYFECMHELKLIVDLILPGRPQLHALQHLATPPNTATTPAARASSTPKPRRR